MPNYEYVCQDCRRRFLVFMTYSEYGTRTVECPHCKSAHVTRKINRVRVARSDESRLASMADPSSLSEIDNDPRALGKMMRQMSSEVGEDMGAEFNEVVHRLESGQSPDQIEKDLPDLGAEPAVSGGDLGDF
jgi:putative FmdB family regulatory protein